MAEDNRTIFALSTARGRAAIAVLRVSGTAAADAVRRLAGRDPPLPRRAVRVRLADAAGSPLDDALLLWFAAPASATGEDVAEFHIHGGPAVARAVLGALSAVPGLRPAEPGEFSKRGFLNGKIDLTAAEGLGDLIEAETEAQRRQALRQLDGGLAALYEDWRHRLLGALAHIEAEIDFADEALPGDLADDARIGLRNLRAEISRHLGDGRRGEVLREGLSVAIVGPPNVGKSSLFNALTRRDTAIVSAIAGTTRDIVEARIDLGGYPVVLADTAGLREIDLAKGDPIEAEGVRRALARAEQADLRLWVGDPLVGFPRTVQGLIGADAILVGNKSDLGKGMGASREHVLWVSARTGAGIDALEARLLEEAERRMNLGEAPALTRVRHRHALSEALNHLDQATGEADIELMAEAGRMAARCLGRLTGRIDVEDLLDIIFRDFCIGK